MNASVVSGVWSWHLFFDHVIGGAPSMDTFVDFFFSLNLFCSSSLLARS